MDCPCLPPPAQRAHAGQLFKLERNERMGLNSPKMSLLQSQFNGSWNVALKGQPEEEREPLMCMIAECKREKPRRQPVHKPTVQSLPLEGQEKSRSYSPFSVVGYKFLPVRIN